MLRAYVGCLCAASAHADLCHHPNAGVVIPLACGAGLVSAVKATSDESAQLGAVIVFSLMLRLHVHVLMPLLTRDDVEDVHMQCRVFTLQMVTCVVAASVAAVWEAAGVACTPPCVASHLPPSLCLARRPLFTAVLWSESTSWLLLLGLLALQSLETLTRVSAARRGCFGIQCRVLASQAMETPPPRPPASLCVRVRVRQLAVHESKVRHRVRTGEALVGTQLLCTVVGAVTCDWACCGPSCMQHCPGVKGTGPFVEWQGRAVGAVSPVVVVCLFVGGHADLIVRCPSSTLSDGV